MASFPGIGHVLDASLNLTHGISPSVAQLTIAPQTVVPSDVGTLAFTFGAVTVEFPGCKIDHSSAERTTGGEIWRLSIFDRRWQWRFGQISGTYNARRDNFSLQAGEAGAIDTERTPQQLATLCLEAMGESDFDVSDLPNHARPSVEWNGVVPAEALAALCDQLGCRVILQLDNRAALRRVGVGAAPPELDALQRSAVINLPERPDAIAVIGGPSRYQVDFPLEAVGLTGALSQNEDALVPIDELAYRPPGGWSTIDLPYYHQVDVESRALAQRSVFKYYRIQTPVAVPGYSGPSGDVIARLEQILPIEDEQVEVASESGQLASQPATVFGVWHLDGLDVANSAPRLVPLEEYDEQSSQRSAGPVYRRPFTIDTARGLVIFDEPVYRNVHSSASGGSGFEVIGAPAELVLRAACSVRDPESLGLARYGRQRQSGANSGTAPRCLQHDEIVLTHKPRYADSYALVDVETNAATADQAADDYLDAAEREYEIANSQTASYPGLVRIELDGAIGQVSFQIGAGGTTTTITRNSESPRLGRAYQAMRRQERGRAAETALSRLSPRNLARWLKTNPSTKPRPRS